jgi:hypothetical protein
MDAACGRAEDRPEDGRVERQRVVVIGRRMLQDLVGRLLSNYPDIELLRAQAGTPLTRAVDDTGARFLIVGNGERNLGAACTALVDARPHVRALAIIDDGRRSVLFEPVGELSPEALVAAVRAPTAAMDRR